MKKFVITLLFLSVLSVQLKAQKEEILFNVGDEAVAKSEFLNSYQKNNQLSTATENDLRDYLSLYINYKLKVKEGKELKMDTASSFQREFQSYRKQSAQQYLVDKNVNARLVEEAKERQKSYIRTSHLMVACAPDATPKDTLAAYNTIMNIRNKIVNNEISFADAAVRYSEDHSAQDAVNPNTHKKMYGNKGDLGYCTVFQLVYPFENAMYNTPIGSISMPVRSQFGYHIIYVVDKIPALKTIEVAQIFFADSLAAYGKMSENVKTNILQTQTQLKILPFDSVARIFSEDQYSKNKGGRMEPFTVNRRPGDFVKTAVNLTLGQISEPVATTMGWHILQLIAFTPDELSKEEADYFVKGKIAKDSRSHLSKNSLVNRLKKEYQYQETGKNAAIKFLDKNLPEEFFTNNMYDINALKGVKKLKQVVNIDNKPVDASGFIVYLSRFRGVNLQELTRKQFLEERFNAFVDDIIINYENTQLETKFPEFKNLMDEYISGMILYDLNTNKVWEKAMLDSTGLVNFYESIKTEYPTATSGEFQPLEEIKSVVITRYQDYLEKLWIADLNKKYPVKIQEEVFKSILKK
ncbi:MAG: peptidylprolyl isomerase [Bacteroidales bacterium]|jgi:peptidyl-prolyl cis-trans isomerase SurA|nr:peptidylprolyl isomerase [Bacteroidales bacterium]